MKKSYRDLRTLYIIISFLISIQGLIGTILLFRTNNGDPLINIVFSKFLSNGFFYYGYEGPKWGATSPLFVLIMRPLFYLSEYPMLIYFKIYNLLLFLIAGYLINKLFLISFEKYKSWSFVIPAMTFGNIYFGFLTATLYDSILLMVTISTFQIFLFKFFKEAFKEGVINKNYFLLLGTWGGLSLLSRPESLLLIMFSYLWLYTQLKNIFNLNKKFRIYFLKSISIIFFINAIYYLPMIILTKSLIPSSIFARATLASNSFVNILNILKHGYWYLKIFTGLICLSFFSLFYRKKFNLIENKVIFFHIISILIYLPILFFSSEVRYISSVYSSIILPSSISIILLMKSIKINKILFFFLIFFFITIYTYGNISLSYFSVIIPNYTQDIIFEKEAANHINSIASKNDQCLTYEIQIQYFLKCNTISLDGIVGGEILPYLKNQSNLIDFVQKYKPKFLIISNAFSYRTEFKNTFLYELYLLDKKIPVLDSLKIGNLIFKKLFVNKKPQLKGMSTWISIYQIEY